MVEKTEHPGLWPSIYEPFRTFGTRMADWLSPASDACAAKDAYTITMELPGVGENDVEVTADDGVITVKGEKQSSREEKGDTWFFSERQYGAFRRSFRLPADADDAAVSADMKDGVLTITVPKRSEEKADKAKRVPISRG